MEKKTGSVVGNSVFDWTDKTKQRPSTQVVLNYNGDLKIRFKDNVQKTVSKNGYLLAGPFTQETGQKAHLLLNGQQYYVSKIYVLAKEVIVQHEPVMNGTPVTLRIPIVSADPKNSEFTCIDRLLSSTPIVGFNLNHLLKEGDTAALYAGGTTLYLQTGISIQTVIPSKNAVNPFDEIGMSLFDPDYTLVSVHLADDHEIPASTGGPPLLEGMEDDNIYTDDMECTPMDIGSDNVQFMQVPITDESVLQQSDKNTMFGILNMFYMGIAIMFLVFMIPYGMNYLKENKQLNLSEMPNTGKTNFKSWFLLTSLSVFIMAIFITLDGSDRHNVSESKAGLVIFFLAFVSSAIFIVTTYLFNTLKETSGELWNVGKIMDFLFECFPFKKFGIVSYIAAFVFIVFLVSVTIDKELVKGSFSLTPNSISWGVFMAFAVGLVGFMINGGSKIITETPLGKSSVTSAATVATNAA